MATLKIYAIDETEPGVGLIFGTSGESRYFALVTEAIQPVFRPFPLDTPFEAIIDDAEEYFARDHYEEVDVSQALAEARADLAPEPYTEE